MRYFLTILFLYAWTLQAADTGYKSASASSGLSWQDKTNAYASDNTYSYAQYAYPDTIILSTFAFGLTTETPIGIEVQLEVLQGDVAPYYAHFKVEVSGDAGSTWTTTGYYCQTLVYNVKETYTLGSSSSSWGLTLTASKFSDANFRLRIIATDDGGGPWTSQLDWAGVKVHYSTGGYTPVGGRDLTIWKNGIEQIVTKDGLNLYVHVNTPASAPSSDPYVIFAENFAGVTDLDQAWFESRNVSTGCFNASQVYLADIGGDHDEVMQIDIKSTDSGGEPLCNTRIQVDSVYHRMYLQEDIYIPGGWLYGEGSKFPNAMTGGEAVDMSYRGDTTTGFVTLDLLRSSGNIEFYHYSHNANGYGTTLTSSVQMPSAAHADVSPLYGKDYSWYKESTNLGTPTGYFAAYPSRIDWDGSKWYWASEGYLGTLSTGWNTVTTLVDLNFEGNHDIYAVYVGGVCTYVKSDNRFLIADNSNWGIEGIYLNLFFNSPPGNQTAYVDNIIAFNLPSSNEYFKVTPEVGDEIPIISPTQQIVTTQATPKDERYTEASGTVYGINPVFHYQPKYMTVDKTISVTGATSYNVTLTQFGWNNSAYSGDNPYVKIYKYVSGVETLVRTYDESAHTLGSNTITCDSVRIEYYNGGKPYWRNGGAWNFIATYTSNGTGSGTNPVYNEDMVAIKPE
jgi:hypothetical protein